MRVLVPATSRGDQVLSCELPILAKNVNLVPRIDLFEFVGPVPGTSPTSYAWSLSCELFVGQVPATK